MLLPIVILSFVLATSSQARNLARLVSQPRASYEGGWALGLPGATCPADAPVACGTNDGTVNPTCCPSGQTCFGLTTPHCCPTDTDCVNVVTNLPVCANSTWNMYELANNDGYFCCEPDQIGVLPLNGYAGLCEPTDQAVANSLIATPASQVGGAAVTSAAGAGKTTPTATKVGATATATSSSGSQSTGQSSSGGSSSSGSSTITADLEKVHLSIGAIVGIAVGGIAVIIVALFLLWKCCCARRRRNDMRAVEPYRNVNEAYAQPAYNVPPVQYGPPVQEYKEPEVGVQGHGIAYGGQGYGVGQDYTSRAEMGQ